MSKRQQWALVGGLAAASLAVVLLLAARRTGESPPVEVGERAPAFMATTLSDPAELRSLDDYAGHLVLLNVWATWCAPCREEMPTMQRLQEEYGSRGLRVVAVSVDSPGDRDKVRGFVEEMGLTFDVFHDESASIMDDYELLGLPQSFLIDPEGTIRHEEFSADWFSPEKRALVEELLGER